MAFSVFCIFTEHVVFTKCFSINGCWCHHSMSLLHLMCLLKRLCGYSWCFFPRSLSTAWKQQIRTVINGLFYNVSRKQEFLQTFVTCPNSNFLFFSLSLSVFLFFSICERLQIGGSNWRQSMSRPWLSSTPDSRRSTFCRRYSKNLSEPQTCLCVCVSLTSHCMSQGLIFIYLFNRLYPLKVKTVSLFFRSVLCIDV